MAEQTSSAGVDFFAKLVEDHTRIEVQLKELLQAADALNRGEDTDAGLAVMKRTLQFFATEGARHEELEERTLFPHLRGRAAFTQILSAFEFQHRMNRTEGQALAEAIARFAPANRHELRRVAVRFAEMHRGHAVAEERALFPLAASTLPPDVLAELARAVPKRS